jgi:hypothetical protein
MGKITDMETTPFQRCLIHALVDSADTDKIISWLQGFGWTGYSTQPEMVERAILELRDKLLAIDAEDKDDDPN